MTPADRDPLEALREELEKRPFQFAGRVTYLAACAEAEWGDLALAAALRLAGNEALRLLAERQEGPQKEGLLLPPAATPEGKGGGDHA